MLFFTENSARAGFVLSPGDFLCWACGGERVNYFLVLTTFQNSEFYKIIRRD